MLYMFTCLLTVNDIRLRLNHKKKFYGLKIIFKYELNK